MTQPADKDPRVGSVLQGRYRILSRIAAGGMGVVYKGERLALGRPVAIKLLHPWVATEKEFLRRFEVEARAMSRLSHPHCVSVIDFGIEDDAPYLVMDYVVGTTLRALVQKGSGPAPTPVGRALHITRQILFGLAHAHKEGIVHRDIKPENIVLTEATGFGDHVRILDFGLAKLRDATSTMTQGLAVGTPSYMSPEQTTADKVDARTDVYSVGVVLYELLTGRRPFESKDLYDLLRMHRDVPAPSLRDAAPQLSFSLELDAVVLKALAKSPEARHPSAGDFAKALEEVPEAANRPRTPGALQLDPRDVAFSATVAVPSGSVPAPPALPGPPASPGADPALMTAAATPAARADSDPVAATPAGPRADETPSAVPPPAAAGAPAPRAGLGRRVRIGAAIAGSAALVAVISIVAAGGGSDEPSVTAAASEGSRATAAEARRRGDDESAAARSKQGARERTTAAERPSREEPDREGRDVPAARKDSEPSGHAPPPPPPASGDDVTAMSSQPGDPPELARILRYLGRRSGAAEKDLLRIRRAHPRSGRVAYVIGRVYFSWMYWNDGFKAYEAAVAHAPSVRSDPILIKDVIGALMSDRVHRRAAAFLERKIGEPAIPHLEQAAEHAAAMSVRRRAASLLARMR